MTIKMTNVEVLAEGYEVLVQEAGIKTNMEITDKRAMRLQNLLVNDGDWTPQGAEEILHLAKRYGVFMLRNALALAITLGIEDGNAGF